ncbi:Zinc finger and BTB domain-containing protein 49 [Portunus trituberculatus]|uniref:Zinc finger and BTB domain-containing protein 49 n=2 Tax=Portunus trituberculatus TaxID=210409 RepID=A0A5B7F8V1_PORTR|nr:Zinc finger and BTB domain-containing protein 49 [Portunus trituberculatus]
MNSTRFPELCKDVRCDSDADQRTPCPSPTPTKLKKQIPALIKINSRPPAIKTPLKCPECPMQFCTVRSLLWHFAYHGARSRENCLPPILLQDLIVPWDKPTVSLFISQAAEGEKSTEKIIASTEMSLAMSPSPDAAMKVDTASKQDLIMATQILKADDGMGTNGDVILKVPIPRLKPKSQGPSTFKKDKFINILPKITSSDSQGSITPAASHLAKIGASSSPTPQITIHAQNNKPTDVVTVKPQSSVPKITIRADSSSQQVHVKPIAPASAHSAVQIKPLITSSQSAVQIQPLLSSSQPAIQIQPLVSTSQSALQIQPLVSSSQSSLQIQPLVSTSQSALQIQPLVSSSQSALQIQPLVSSSQSGLQIQPLVSGTHAAVQPIASTTTKSSSGTSHIALIPVDNLSAVGQNFPSKSKTVPPPIRMMAPSPLPVKTSPSSMDGILEKDGLVMINSNLALRIVSSLPSTLESGTSTTTSTTTIRPIATHLTTNNNLTILPQVEGSKLSNSKKESMKNPDILTIVPQIDVNKKVSLLKNAPSTPNTQASIPKSSPASQVVKLYLLQPKDTKGKNGGDSTTKLGIPTEPSIGMNGLEVPLPLSNGNESTATSENGNSREQGMNEEEEIEDLDEEEEEGMVIDDERDGDEDVMDPLSLCAVTMEDENLDASNSSSQADQFSADSATSSEDKVTIRKIVGKPKGKTNQGVDIVKYEARKYVCCYCNRRFGWSTDLKRHVILHTGEKPFQCKVCPTAFTRKFLLQNHMKRMHPDKCKMSDLWP